MLASLVGLDHLVVAVRDLDAAAAEWAALGFTVSPRGLHSPHMGSGNHTMMFGEDYLELLGVVTPQPHNEALRGFLAGREGLERAAFTTTDAEAGAAAIRAQELAANGPVHFGRPVPLPDGTTTRPGGGAGHHARDPEGAHPPLHPRAAGGRAGGQRPAGARPLARCGAGGARPHQDLCLARAVSPAQAGARAG